MENDKVQRINELCSQFIDDVQLGKVWFEGSDDFPYGCCGSVSEKLCELMEREGLSGATYKWGWRANQSHAWVEYDDLIIDVTISQFPEYQGSKIFIEQKDQKGIHQEFIHDGN